MRYRNVIQEQAPRPIRAPLRRTHPPATSNDHSRQPLIEEPLINIHDTPSRFEDAKEFASAISRSLSARLLPFVLRAKKTVKQLFSLHARQLSRYYKQFKTTKRLSRPAIATLAVYVVIIVGSYIALQQFSPSAGPITATLGDNASQQRPSTNEKPTFATILPQGKSIDSLGGWARVSPPDRDPVFAFVDTLGEQQITISQQPLPNSSSENTEDTIQSIAYDFSAKERRIASDGTVYYVGTSSNGTQSIITGKDQLLILIKSPAVISNDNWSAYIASLR